MSAGENGDLPRQSQLLLPLMEEIRDAGGAAKPGELYDRLAERLGLAADVRAKTVDTCKCGPVNAYERQVRWTRQTGVARGYIDGLKRNLWELTDKADAHLKNIVRGKIVTVYEDAAGFVMWASAEDAMGVIERKSVDLLFCSPPYPLINEKEYRNLDETRWLDWMIGLCEGWREILCDSGSMMINLGPTWRSGGPTQSLYIERLLIALEDKLGIHLLQRLDWYSPSKMPTPIEWVGIRRIRVTSAVEPILWLSPNPYAEADNRRVLRPYSKSGLRAIANPRDGKHKRPSGYVLGPTSYLDNGGSIPPSLITASHSDSNSAYRRAERAAGRTPHPATFPEALPEFGIKLATQEGGLVYDPFCGSGTTLAVARRLNRRFIGNDRSKTYLDGSKLNLAPS